jgi:hypothetical protein
MNEPKKFWLRRFGVGQRRGLFWGLILVALGGF